MKRYCPSEIKTNALATPHHNELFELPPRLALRLTRLSTFND